jgi:thioredoxin-dependent peroxiredoxin
MHYFRTIALATAVLALVALTGLRAEDKKDEPTKVEEGKPAPDVSLEATQIEKVLPDKKDLKVLSLKDLKGKNVVLFFFPKAMTRGCTIESCGFRDKTADFAKLDTVVIGISTDKLDDQMKFTEKEKLNFPLFADPDKKATKAFGALSDRGFASRYTFVIDKKGIVRKIYTKVSPNDHPEEVLKFVKENLTDSK